MKPPKKYYSLPKADIFLEKQWSLDTLDLTFTEVQQHSPWTPPSGDGPALTGFFSAGAYVTERLKCVDFFNTEQAGERKWR